MSFACPHFEFDKDYCLLLQAACVPGRPGCVLRKNSVFWVPAEERLKEVPAQPARPKLQPARPRRGQRPA